MSTSGLEKIGELLSSSLPRDFLLDLQRMIPGALERVRKISEAFMLGHQASVLGHTRHFALNETLVQCLDESGIPHPPLKGNAIMVGKVGVVSMARVHMGQSQWDNSRRSKTKVKLCKPNFVAKRMVQGDIFDDDTPIAEMTAFIVTEGDGSNGIVPIYLVVPDEKMDLRNPVFKEELSVFMQRYQQPQDVVDRVDPKLKPGVKKQDKQENGDNTEPTP